MDPEHIDEIKAGKSRVVRVTWSLPRGLLSKDNGTEKHHSAYQDKFMMMEILN